MKSKSPRLSGSVAPVDVIGDAVLLHTPEPITPSMKLLLVL